MKKVFSFAAIFLLITGMAMGQSQNGSVSGVITDQTGAAVSNATVTVTNVGTGAVRTVKTNNAGDYRVEGSASAGYTLLRVNAAGFGETKTGKFNVSVGSSNVVNAKVSVKVRDLGGGGCRELAGRHQSGKRRKLSEVSGQRRRSRSYRRIHPQSLHFCHVVRLCSGSSDPMAVAASVLV